MKVVSENSKEELARRRKYPAVEWALKDLAANLMRVARGSGEPQRIYAQCFKLIEAMSDYSKEVGTWPSSHHLQASLDCQRDLTDYLRSEYFEELDAYEIMLRGALQVVASRLLEQKTQESAGDHQLHDGRRMLEKAREDRRKLEAKAARQSDIGQSRRIAKGLRRKKPDKEK